jgi:hypothetical protein
LKRSKRYAVAGVEANTFALEQTSLPRCICTAKADRPLRIHDALPWNRFPARDRVERVTNETRLPRQPRDARHLTIGGHSATWYS